MAAPLLVACQPVPAAPLALGLNAWVGYDPLVLARERGLIDTRAVKVIELSSSSETLRHFRNRLLDAAALTLDEALRLADEGFDPRVVAVLSASAGADVVLAVPEVRDLAGLRGRVPAGQAFPARAPTRRHATAASTAVPRAGARQRGRDRARPRGRAMARGQVAPAPGP